MIVPRCHSSIDTVDFRSQEAMRPSTAFAERRWYASHSFLAPWKNTIGIPCSSYPNMNLHMYITCGINIYIYINTYVYIYIYINTYVYIYIYNSYINVYTCIYIYINTACIQCMYIYIIYSIVGCCSSHPHGKNIIGFDPSNPIKLRN